MKVAPPIYISEAEVSWVRQLEEAVLGNYSQLPGAIPTPGYSICRSTGSWNSCGLTAAGEVCDPHSSWETSGTCPHGVTLAGETWGTSDRAALSLCCSNTKVLLLVASLLHRQVLWDWPRHWRVWRYRDQPADFSLDLDRDLGRICGEDAGFDVSGADILYSKKSEMIPFNRLFLWYIFPARHPLTWFSIVVKTQTSPLPSQNQLINATISELVPSWCATIGALCSYWRQMTALLLNNTSW